MVGLYHPREWYCTGSCDRKIAGAALAAAADRRPRDSRGLLTHLDRATLFAAVRRHTGIPPLSRSSSIIMFAPAVCALALTMRSGMRGGSCAGASRAPTDRTRHVSAFDRREVLGFSAAALAAFAWPTESSAASSVPTRAELERLVVGYRGIVNLLDNWDAETIKCDKFDSAEKCGTAAQKRAAASSNMASCSCDFNPGRVQEVMGFKSIKHPLYMADQLMIRAQPLLSPTADTDVYDAAVEAWTRKAEDANVMSYTSSWGEANPGGGRDAVARYLDRSRKEVRESADLLRTILASLDMLPANM